MAYKAIIIPCQKKCLDFRSRDISETEQSCITACLDKFAFLDNATYELDSATTLANMQGKPKKAFMYYNRRIADLTSAPTQN